MEIQMEMDFETGGSCLPTVRSVGHDQQRIMADILRLYGIRAIDLDFTYSIGNFYKGGLIPQPKHKMDVNPQTDDTVGIGKLQPIPLEDGSCGCIVYDPPFVLGPPDCASMTTDVVDGSVIIQKRFASFRNSQELTETYWFHMKEMYRLLSDGGYAIVKCQNCVGGQADKFPRIPLAGRRELGL